MVTEGNDSYTRHEIPLRVSRSKIVIARESAKLTCPSEGDGLSRGVIDDDERGDASGGDCGGVQQIPGLSEAMAAHE